VREALGRHGRQFIGHRAGLRASGSPHRDQPNDRLLAARDDDVLAGQCRSTNSESLILA
jgi:hypothetical protein